ncbi:lanthionine synthetase C family protein [Fodinicola acaciae]|uniref:lanthionine synthetase C family protein n=1 Tax=Fodinicola acaciae TaxID=2681555 RepID=UPI0013D2D0AE|nr:lanthionine synthetase C family protein [Fodinicola acaciae]
MTSIVESIAASLADPDRVRSIASASRNAMVLPGRRVSPWRSAALSDGFPSLALLHAELGQHDLTHEYLSAALASDAPPALGLYNGIASLAFAAHAASTVFGGYDTLLTELDHAIVSQLRARVRHDRERLAAGQPLGSWDAYDVISGASGVARLLLARYEATQDDNIRDAVTDVISLFVAAACGGDKAWWVDTYAYIGQEGPPGHLNLGLAHGIAGPLALLAICWRRGVKVDRQQEAMGHIVDLLAKWQQDDDRGPFWPSWIRAGEGPPVNRSREVWCYGCGGVGRALHLAGKALERPKLAELGESAMQSALTVAGAGIGDFALCHGWSGLLQIANRMAWDTNAATYQCAADRIAATIRSGFRDDHAFGFRYTHPAAPAGTDRAGFLEGAAGIALALHEHATGRPSATGWDAALMLT